MFGASLGSLNLKDLKLKGGQKGAAYRGWEDLWRQKWTWDKVAFGTIADSTLETARSASRQGRYGLARERLASTSPRRGVPANPMAATKRRLSQLYA
jgi:hypothetical protein